jgi:hypothetical protein
MMHRLNKDKFFYIGLTLLWIILEVAAWLLMDLKGVPSLAEEMRLFFPGG